MNIYRLNECEWYAANSAEEAVSTAMADTGNSREEIIYDDYFTGQPEPLDNMCRDEETGLSTSFGEFLKTMDSPGLIFTSE